MDQREVEERLGEEAWRVLPWTAQAFASGQRSRSRSRSPKPGAGGAQQSGWVRTVEDVPRLKLALHLLQHLRRVRHPLWVCYLLRTDPRVLQPPELVAAAVHTEAAVGGGAGGEREHGGGVALGPEELLVVIPICTRTNG